MVYKHFDSKKFIILRDSREQIKRFSSSEWLRKFKVEDRTLSHGDYSFEYNGDDFSSHFGIEYKRVCELLGNIGSDDRQEFKDKIYNCARRLDFYRVVVEGSLGQFIDPLYCQSKMDRFLAFTTIYKWQSDNRHLKFEFIPDSPIGTAQTLAEMVIFQFMEGYLKYNYR